MTDWLEVTIIGGAERSGRKDRTLLNQREIFSITQEYDGIRSVRDIKAEVEYRIKWIDYPKEWWQYILFWTKNGYYTQAPHIYKDVEVHTYCCIKMKDGKSFDIEENYELLVPHLLSKLRGYDDDDD